MYEQPQPQPPTIPVGYTAGHVVNAGQPTIVGYGQAPKPNARPALVAAMIGGGLVLFGAGIGVGNLAPFGSAAAPVACIDSIERAEDLLAHLSVTVGLSQQATEAAATQDVEMLGAINDQVVARIPEVRETRTAFDAAVKDCRSAR